MSENEIQRVAVIGAGISGVVSAAHLLASGKQVTVFERSQAAGGVWLYDKRVPIEAQYPSLRPSNAQQYVRDGREGKERQELLHAPPGPCYESLTNNVSTPLLRTTLNSWPEGTDYYVSHSVLKDYIQDTSRKTGVTSVTTYGAQVTNIQKIGQEWHVSWNSLRDDQNSENLAATAHSQAFDAIVIASGHYHTPLVPDIPGLSEIKEKWPTKITHSKSFRNAEGFEQKNVLLIGGGVSSTDIARELSSASTTIYQSTRNGAFDVPATALPSNASRIAEVARFEINGHQKQGDVDGHLPITAYLKSGETIEGIDRIVLCTGYQMTLPFFPQYNDNSLSVTEANDTLLITDGTQIHNLHHDIFYIPDPTLAFVGIPFYTATFTLFEFQAIAVTELFSGRINLPSTADMRSEYAEKILLKGYRRGFHSLKGEEEDYVKLILGWVNSERGQRGLAAIDGHTGSWIEAKKEQIERLTQVYFKQGVINSPVVQVKEVEAAA